MKNNKNVTLFLLTIGYMLLAGVLSNTTGLYIVSFSLLPLIFNVFFGTNESKYLQYLVFTLNIIIFSLSPWYGRTVIIFYLFMSCVLPSILFLPKNNDIKKTEEKLIKLIAIMTIIFIACFAVYDNYLTDVHFFDSLHKLLTNVNILNEISENLYKNMGKNKVDFSQIDSSVLIMAINTFLTILVINLVSILSIINYYAIEYYFAKEFKEHHNIKPLSQRSISSKLFFSMIILLLLGYFLSVNTDTFGSGLVSVILILLFELYIIQGFFVISFAINKSKIQKKLQVPVLIALLIFLLLNGIGTFVLMILGFVDTIFNVRKIVKE